MTSQKPNAGVIANVVLVLCALVLTGLVVRRELWSKESVLVPGEEAAPQLLEGRPGLMWGAAESSVSLVLFSDFQCPFCRQMAGTLDSLLATGLPLRIVFKHYPIEAIHPVSLAAARAAECAAMSGRFKAYHDRLFAAQDTLARIDLVALAASAGVIDTTSFRLCASSPSSETQVRKDQFDADELGVRATPTLFVNGHRVRGGATLTELKDAVERLR